MIVAEEKKEGKVGWSVYRMYIKSAGGYFLSSLVLLTFVIALASQSFASWWLSHWLQQGSGVSIYRFYLCGGRGKFQVF